MKSIKHYLKSGLILIGISSISSAGLAGTAEPSLKITLHVRNYANVESQILIRAEQETTRIFGQIGIETLWVDPSPVPKERQDSPRDRMSEITLNVLPRAMENLGPHDTSLGVAPGVGRNRDWAYLFYDRVEDLSRKQTAAVVQRKVGRRATTAQILGYAMAHEIGHLLGLEHSPAGVMRAEWRWNDLLDLAYGDLVFTPQQAAVVRNEVQIRQQEVLGPPTIPKSKDCRRSLDRRYSARFIDTIGSIDQATYSRLISLVSVG